MATTKKLKKQKNIYEIDGIIYAVKAYYDFHVYLNEHKKYISSYEIPTQKVKSKYGAAKVHVNGIKFDSIVEAKYYVYLLKEKATRKNIKEIKMQVPFILQEGIKKNGKTILPIKYIADFVVDYTNDTTRVIDIKGVVTADFKIKRKIFEYKYHDYTLECINLYEDKWLHLDEIEKLRKEKKKEKAAEKKLKETKKIGRGKK
jgi:hypothetical protein